MTSQPRAIWRHPLIWVCAPLALALLYGAGHALLAPAPTLQTLAPKETLLVQRFRSLAVFDKMQPAGPRAPSESLGENLNMPGLVGIDRTGPIHMLQMPRTGLQVRSLVILPVEDAAAVEAHFNDVQLIDKGFIRRAQHLRLYDGWAAFSPDRDLTRRLGEGGLTLPDKSEDFGLAADIPALVDHALSLPYSDPWRDVLRGMGVKLPGGAATQAGGPRALSGLGHIGRLRSAWSSMRMWTWFANRATPHVEVVLDAATGPTRDVLARLMQDIPPATHVPVPQTADAWLRIPDARARAGLVFTAFSLGVPFGLSADADGGTLPETVALLSKTENSAGGLAVWSTPSIRSAGVLEFGASGAGGALPDPTGWLPGDGWITRDVQGFAVAASGGDARRVLDQYAATIVMDGTPRGDKLSPDRRLLGTAYLSLARARGWLGGLVRPGGLWAMLDGHDLLCTISTDGQRLYVDVLGMPKK